MPVVASSDVKTLHSSACQWADPDVARPTFAAEGIFNFSAETQTLVCPIVRDDTGGGDARVSSIGVLVRDFSANAAVEC